MVSEYDMDSTWSTLVTDFIKVQLSTYSAAPDSILGNISTIPVSYGKRTTQRTIQDPDTLVHVSREFQPHRAPKVTEPQNLDLANLSDSFVVPRADFAADPEGVRIHVRDTGANFRNGIEKLMMEGSTVNVVTRGIADVPGVTGGTINRPELQAIATTGDWSTTANMRADLINALAALNVYVIDTSKVHLGISQVMMDAYYVSKDHAYYWDWEVYCVPMFDPLYDGTEYLKGVASILSLDWED